ncbi:uncharacterized protein E6C27_scaffold75G001340 [Cucumis melo var. makuwa]|uniref:Transmembrane protein n=1 Tax=Cucumis melo var. makuwa TaxID=1194695 RepID=A0A5A7TI98_CUCMM|nr:uncharacterized protein E6C27_scaffold75G001340 [Cucumis melo var. makuwa]
MFKVRSLGIALIMILMAIPNFAIFAESRMLRSEAEGDGVKEHDVDEKPKRLIPQPKDSSSSGNRVVTLASGPSRKGGGH